MQLMRTTQVEVVYVRDMPARGAQKKCKTRAIAARHPSIDRTLKRARVAPDTTAFEPQPRPMPPPCAQA